jgi:hypothetical protein
MFFFPFHHEIPNSFLADLDLYIDPCFPVKYIIVDVFMLNRKAHIVMTLIT